mgnify:CR=1 FL=1
MTLAVVATLMGPGSGFWLLSLILIAGGAVIGHQLATRVQMTQMPELVAIMHSLVGLAAVFVGFNAHIMIGTVAGQFAEAGLAFPGAGTDWTGTAVEIAEQEVRKLAVLKELSQFGQLIAKKTSVEINILKVELVLGIWIGAVLLLALGLVAPPSFMQHFIVFVLAVFVGFQVIWNVSHALHTPLMAITNAISSIIILGALLQIGSGSFLVILLAAVSVFMAGINIFGGFLVTRRMLAMFQKS